MQQTSELTAEENRICASEVSFELIKAELVGGITPTIQLLLENTGMRSVDGIQYRVYGTQATDSGNLKGALASGAIGIIETEFDPGGLGLFETIEASPIVIQDKRDIICINMVEAGNISTSNVFVMNLGFEQGSGTDADDWDENVPAVRDSGQVLSGGYSMKIPVSGSSATVTQTGIELEPDTDYMLYGWIYEVSNGGAARLSMVGPNGESCQDSGSTFGTWEYISCTFTTDPATTTVDVTMFSSGNKDVWFDNINILEVV